MKNYLPLIIIIALISLASLALTYPTFDLHALMRGFMGLFFVLFAMFKLFDIPGFVKGFAMYDLPTQQLRAYGYAYPFIELALGLAYLSGIALELTAWATLILMGISAAGVVISLSKGMNVRCACLGTVLNVPLSTVSAVENIGMGAMAALMLAGW